MRTPPAPRSPSLARRTFTLVRQFVREYRGQEIRVEAVSSLLGGFYVYLQADDAHLPLEQCLDAREAASWLAVGRLMLARAMETMV